MSYPLVRLFVYSYYSSLHTYTIWLVSRVPWTSLTTLALSLLNVSESWVEHGLHEQVSRFWHVVVANCWQWNVWSLRWRDCMCCQTSTTYQPKPWWSSCCTKGQERWCSTCPGCSYQKGDGTTWRTIYPIWRQCLYSSQQQERTSWYPCAWCRCCRIEAKELDESCITCSKNHLDHQIKFAFIREDNSGSY